MKKLMNCCKCTCMLLFATTSYGLMTNDLEDLQTYISTQKEEIIKNNTLLTPRTLTKYMDKAESYTYIQSNKDLYNTNVVTRAAKLGNADGLFAHGLLIEYEAISSFSPEVEAMMLYEKAQEKNCYWACERLYWVYKNGELGKTPDDELKDYYHKLYFTLTGKNITETKEYIFNLEEYARTIPHNTCFIATQLANERVKEPELKNIPLRKELQQARKTRTQKLKSVLSTFCIKM